MAEQADNVPTWVQSSTGSSRSDGASTRAATRSPYHSLLNKATEISHNREARQQEASAVEQILAIVRRKQSHYNRKSSLQAYMDSMDRLKKAKTSSEAARATLDGSSSYMANKPSAAKSKTPAKKPAKTSAAESLAVTRGSPAPSHEIAPRVDRAGNPRPANKRFLERDVTGKLARGVIGEDTQLEEIQAWIKDKKYAKFDLLPEASEYTFEDIDPAITSEPLHLKNTGRKLLLGKDGNTEVWAVQPAHPKKLYMCRLIMRDVVNDTYTGIRDWEKLHDTIDELYYPFEAFVNSERADAWSQLLAVIGYVFLLCGEADVVFPKSSKGPHSLSTALTYIKDTYAPNDAHPTAATVDRTIPEIATTDDTPQLEAVNNLLRQKNLLGRMQQVVSDTSIYVFKDYKAPGTLHAKGIANIHNRALFLGEDDRVETWAAPSRFPNKAILGWVINTDKVTGEQEVVKWWPMLPTLTFPFESYKGKGDALNWRKLLYTVGHIFLCCGEAETAVNLGNAFKKHYVSVSTPKTIEKYYGSVIPPKGWPHVRKPGDFPGDNQATVRTAQPTKHGTFTKITRSTESDANVVRSSLQEILEPNFAPRRNADLAIPTSEDRQGSNESSPSTYTAPSGEYLSIEDLHKSLFLEKYRQADGKWPANDDQENHSTKLQRLEAARAEAKKLRLRQENEVKEAQRVLDNASKQLHLLQEAEVGFAGQIGDLIVAMTDEDTAEL